MRNRQNITIPRADTGIIIPWNPNEYEYLLPTVGTYLAEAVYGSYRLTVTHQTEQQVGRLADAAIRSWRGSFPVAFTADTDDTPALLTLVRAAGLSHDACLTLSFGQSDSQPLSLATPPMDAHTFTYKSGQEVLNREGLDVLTMRSRLEQAGGVR